MNELSLPKKAKIAGILYLFLCIAGGWAHGGVRFPMINYSDSAQTADAILAAKTMFNSGILADFFAQIIMIFLPLALYQLFESVNKSMAFLMVIAGYIGIPITCINMLNQIAAVLILGEPEYLKAFDQNQLQGLATLFLNLQKYGYLIAHIFFGIWLLPMGYLVYKSQFLPKFIGVWLVLGGSVYILQTFLFLDFPELEETISGIAGLTGLSEIVFCFWLLIKGVKAKTQ
jgi:hypothetical protein